MAIARGLSLATPPATIEVCSRSNFFRDAKNSYLLHVQVIVFHGGSGCDGATQPPAHIPALDLTKLDKDLLPPLRPDETPLAYAHFVMSRCDLSTNGDELQQALRNVCDNIACHGDRAARAMSYLVDGISPATLEDVMEAADDRWIDQLATLEAFASSPGLQPADLYAACLRDLLCFTNPTSGMVVVGEFPCLPAGMPSVQVDIDKLRHDFNDQETGLRTIITAQRDEDRSDHLWVSSGIAQVDRQVPGQSWVRIMDSIRYLSAHK